MKSYDRVTRTKIDIPAMMAATEDPMSGGTVLFIGTIRNHSEAGDVDRIDYDAYVPMAERKMVEIEAEIRRRLPVGKVAMQHRVGELGVGEVSVVIAVSAPHRALAFELCRYGIEEIKRVVPIWKKERLADGKEHWVKGKAALQSTASAPGGAPNAGATKSRKKGARPKSR